LIYNYHTCQGDICWSGVGPTSSWSATAHPRGAGASVPKNFGTTTKYDTRNETLHGDETRWKENKYSLARPRRQPWLEVSVTQMIGSVKEPNKFHNYETEKITRKASDAAEYIELFRSFTRDRHARRIWCYSLNVRRYMRRRAWRSRVKEPNNTYVVIGFGELAAVD